MIPYDLDDGKDDEIALEGQEEGKEKFQNGMLELMQQSDVDLNYDDNWDVYDG